MVWAGGWLARMRLGHMRSRFTPYERRCADRGAAGHFIALERPDKLADNLLNPAA